MRKTTKKILSGLMVAMMLLTMVPVSALEATSQTTENPQDVVVNSQEKASSEESLYDELSIETDTSESSSEENSSENTVTDVTVQSSEEETSETVASEEIQLNDTEEEIGEEPEDDDTDNWDISLVFYDSSVGNGRTPLTEIDWDASDGSYHQGEPRVITVQINYSNTNCVRDYLPGEVEISIPNIAYKNSGQSPNLRYEIIASVNDASHEGYSWDFVKKGSYANAPTTDYDVFRFKNASEFNERENFEGSIQIIYTMTPVEESPETDLNECEHSRNIDLTATLKTEEIELESNEISFNYYRKYIHEWKKYPYTLRKTASKLQSYDGLGQNAEDYIWVKYTFTAYDYYTAYNTNTLTYFVNYTSLNNVSNGNQGYVIFDDFPEECVLKTLSGGTITPYEGNTYKFTKGKSGNVFGNPTTFTLASFYVGYPKSVYNETNNNLNITNTADLYVQYYGDDDISYASTASVDLNLAEFGFNYTGELYGVSKSIPTGNNIYPYTMYYQSIADIYDNFGSDGKFMSGIYFSAIYSGKNMDIEVGDDLLYITDANNHYRMLNTDEYCFTKIYFPSGLRNANGNNVPDNKYDVDLYLRKGNGEYELYSSFKNQYKLFTFEEEDDVTGFYFVIKNVDQSLICQSTSSNYDYRLDLTSARKIHSVVKISTDTDIYVGKGNVYNFGYLKVYDQEHNVLNGVSLGNYSTLLTQLEIAEYDIENYGEYRQRCAANVNYLYFEGIQDTNSFGLSKTMSSPSQIIQDNVNEVFKGTSTINAAIRGYNTVIGKDMLANFYQTIPESNWTTAIDIYDLMPQGMDVASSEEEIINSLSTPFIGNENYLYCINKSGTFLTAASFINLMKQCATVTIENNWNSSGQTLVSVHIDLTDNPIFLIHDASTYSASADTTNFLSFKYSWKVTYDSYEEHGSVWKNEVFGKSNGTMPGLVSPVTDTLDINNDGDTTDRLTYASATTTIPTISESLQSVKTLVETTLNNFTSSTVKSPYDEIYTYKLRVKTGQSDTTNVVIIDNLEEAYGNNDYWQGQFLNVDTSYIENKTFYIYDPSNPNANAEGTVPERVKVKVYYSDNPSEGGLYLSEETVSPEDSSVPVKVFLKDDNGNLIKNPSWHEYSEDIDKSQVKSLAFELLNAETNESAVIPANSLLYVLVDMHSPEDPYPDDTIDNPARPFRADILTLAYNNCWTQWNPISPVTEEPIDFITGIDSNIVKVFLPYSLEILTPQSISVRFEKFINGTDEAWERLKLDKNDTYYFPITMTNVESGDKIQGVLTNKGDLVFGNVLIGTYVVTEADDNYFDFVSMIGETDVEGVTFDGTTLTITEDIADETIYNIDVTNKLEPERFYEDKEEKPNLIAVIYEILR